MNKSIEDRLNHLPDYRQVYSHDIEYKGFMVKRHPEFGLWKITTMFGEQVSGLGGSFTQLTTAQQHIDRFLSLEEQKKKNASNQAQVR